MDTTSLGIPGVNDLLRAALVPTRFSLVSGKAEGRTPLTAFDKALLDAGIGNLNLLRVSSILPPRARYEALLGIPAGALAPMAYASRSSEVSGERIAAAVGVGVPHGNRNGVIMEYSGTCSQGEAEAQVEAMVREAFEARGTSLERFLVKGVDHVVDHAGCVVAAVPLWY